MVDGFTIELDPELAARLKAGAEELGMSPTGFVVETIEHRLLDDDWSEDMAAFEEYDRTGEFVTLEAALEEFNAALEARLAERR